MDTTRPPKNTKQEKYPKCGNPRCGPKLVLDRDAVATPTHRWIRTRIDGISGVLGSLGASGLRKVGQSSVEALLEFVDVSSKSFRSVAEFLSLSKFCLSFTEALGHVGEVLSKLCRSLVEDLSDSRRSDAKPQ